MAIIKSLQTINAGEDVEKRECSCTAGGIVKWYNSCGKQYGYSSEMKTIDRTTIRSSNPTSGYVCKGIESRISEGYLHTPVHSGGTSHNSHEVEATQMFVLG